MSQGKFNILAIDGGGVRGIYPAYILQCMTERLGINIYDQFDMIAGTSTGSIVAAAVACKIPPEQVVDLYQEHGSAIFSKNRSWPFVFWLPEKYRQALKSKYTSNRLKELLKEILGEVTLGQITKPLLLPATDIGLGGVHVFKSSYSADFTRDNIVPLHQAVLASCAAPTFFDPVKIQAYLLADGGLWANNPALAAVIDAQKRLGIALEDIQVLSLGTGHAKTSYGMETKRRWGLMNGWRGAEFIGFLMSLQAESTQNYVKLMLQESQLLRLNFETDQPLPLDDCSAIDDLISKADREFTHNSAKIRDFLGIAPGGQHD
jgi:uncharacterized protein